MIFAGFLMFNGSLTRELLPRDVSTVVLSNSLIFSYLASGKVDQLMDDRPCMG